MTLAEAVKLYSVPLEVLLTYEHHGLIKGSLQKNNLITYEEADFTYLGLIDILLKAGFTYEKIKKFVVKKEFVDDKEQLSMLREKRKDLLNEIHNKQKVLDNIDFIIWQTNKNLLQSQIRKNN